MADPIVDPKPAPAPAPTPPIIKPDGKVFTEEYVQTLRGEAADRRLAAKASDERLRKVLGLKPSDEITDDSIKVYQDRLSTERADITSKANDKLLKAEVKLMVEYDEKLAWRLMDKSKITFADDGIITGLKEELEKVAVEFPQIKVTPAAGGTGGHNPPNTGTPAELDLLKKEYDVAIKSGNTAQVIGLKNKIFKLEH